MNEFVVELFVASDDEQDIMLSSLNEDEMEQWKKDMEARALSEYHNKKIKIKSKKFDFKKRHWYNNRIEWIVAVFFREGG